MGPGFSVGTISYFIFEIKKWIQLEIKMLNSTKIEFFKYREGEKKSVFELKK